MTKATRFDRAEKCKNINLLAINGNKNQKMGSLSIVVIKYKKIKILYHMKASFFIKGDTICTQDIQQFMHAIINLGHTTVHACNN